jgi:hypothetical protein
MSEEISVAPAASRLDQELQSSSQLQQQHDDDLEGPLEIQDEHFLLLSSENNNVSSEPTDNSLSHLYCSSWRNCFICCLWTRVSNRVVQSLAFASTTPATMSFVIPFLCLLNHWIFYVGQTEFMWKLNAQADVDVWYNATGLEAKTAFYSLGLDRETHVLYHKNETVQQFTYSFAIQELWKADGIPGSKFIPRLAAVLLIVFSGIWPHLKLLLLSLTWLLSNNSKRRHRILHWLSTLGKWSLADVLVVCVMVGVLNLNWVVDPTAIKNGFVYQVPLLIDILQHMYSVDDICTYMLHANCSAPPSTWTHAKCTSCRNFVNMEFSHPKTTRTSFAGIAKGVQESGTGYAQLRVEGMNGMYYFCVAVVLSIVLSFVVDVFDAKAQRRDRIAAAEENFYRYSRLSEGSHDEMDVEQSNANDTRRRSEALQLVADDSMYELLRPSGSLSTDSPCVRYGLVLFSTATSLLVLLGAFVYTLERRVIGAIPQVMHDVFGIDWDRQFSFATLARVTGAAGGWDWLLLATFALFVVIGPILRAVMCVCALVLPEDRTGIRLYLHTAIDFIGAFCAWEVVALACFLVSLIMPLATSTIIMKPECVKVDSSGSCFEVSFDLESHFWVIIAGGTMLVFMAYACHLIMPHR